MPLETNTVRVKVKVLVSRMVTRVFLVSILSASFLFAQNILEQIDKKMAPGSSESYKKLINIEPDGTKKEFLLYQARKGNDKMVSAFLKPESEKGRTTLRVGDNMWLYLPEVGRAKIAYSEVILSTNGLA